MMTGDAEAEHEKARRFRDAALPHLDDVYALARYLMRGTADAEDAVQECYLRALRHFDSYRGPAMKPWLLTILRNVCNAEFARRGRQEVLTETGDDDAAPEQSPLWQEPAASPEAALLRRHDDETIRGLVAALPQPFREAIVLREMHDLSYKEIAEELEISEHTVKSQVSNALRILKLKLGVSAGAILFLLHHL